MRHFIRVLMPAICVAVLVTGCRSPKIKRRHFRSDAVVRARTPGSASRWVSPASSDEEALARLRARAEGPEGSSPEGLLTLAELADRLGRRQAPHDQTAAIPWFRDAAAYAMFALTTGGPSAPDSPLRARAVTLHNHAVEEILRCAGSGPRDANPAWREQLAASGVQLAHTNPTRAGLPVTELWIARDFRVRNLAHVGADGVGVPLVAVSHFPDREASPERYYPERTRLPATAVLQPGGPLRDGAWRSRPSTLTLHDPAGESTLAPANLTIASDLTTPMAHQFLISPLKQLTWGGLLRPEDFTSMPGILLPGPHQPGKIPVLFVHGLWSSPDAWLIMSNSLQADPWVREHYEFWYAYYPTGASLMASAVRLRAALHDVRTAIDPRHADPALDRMVVVGHSLGGVLTKQLIQSSGDRLEKALFTRPFDQVRMSPESREMLGRFLYFEPEPSVRRVVFIAAPHRGSNTANAFIGRSASMLVRRSETLGAVHADVIARNGPEAVQPAYRRRLPNSVDNLQWDSPILKALSESPIAPDVPYHSVVANLFPDGPPAFWTDGVVQYESAHLDGSQSEIVVKHNHFANVTPEATAEVRRILKLHLGVTQ